MKNKQNNSWKEIDIKKYTVIVHKQCAFYMNFSLKNIEIKLHYRVCCCDVGYVIHIFWLKNSTSLTHICRNCIPCVEASSFSSCFPNGCLHILSYWCVCIANMGSYCTKRSKSTLNSLIYIVTKNYLVSIRYPNKFLK